MAMHNLMTIKVAEKLFFLHSGELHKRVQQHFC